MNFFEKRPMIMILIGILGISLSGIFVKYSTAPSGVTAAWRLLWTVLFLTPAVFSSAPTRRELFSLPKKNLFLSLLSGLFLAIHFVLWFESLSLTTVAASTAIVCTEVIWVSLGFLFLGGKLSLRAILAIAITLLGSVLIAWGDFGDASQFLGDILSLLAAIAVAVYTLIGRTVRKTTGTTVYTYVVYAACAGVLLLYTLARGTGLFAYGTSAPIVGLLLSVFSTLLGHSIFSWCLKYFSPAFVSASKLCEPVVAAIFAVFLFGELPTPLLLLGGGLILGGVFYYSRLEMREDKS